MGTTASKPGPDVPLTALPAAVIPRVEVGADGCWRWTGPTMGAGYGQLSVRGRRASLYVHRVVWEFVVGPIPRGEGARMVIDHLCENKACCRPSHLQCITQSEHIARHRRKRETCARGHAWTPETITYVGPVRRCRTCVNENQRAYNARRLAARGDG